MSFYFSFPVYHLILYYVLWHRQRRRLSSSISQDMRCQLVFFRLFQSFILHSYFVMDITQKKIIHVIYHINHRALNTYTVCHFFLSSFSMAYQMNILYLLQNWTMSYMITLNFREWKSQQKKKKRESKEEWERWKNIDFCCIFLLYDRCETVKYCRFLFWLEKSFKIVRLHRNFLIEMVL